MWSAGRDRPSQPPVETTDLYTSFYLGSRFCSARNLHLGTQLDVCSSFIFLVEERIENEEGKEKRQIEIIQEARFRGRENRDQSVISRWIAIRTVPSLKRKKNTSAVGLATAETRSRVARPRQVRSNKKEEIVAPKGVLHRLFSGYLFISRRSFNHHR